MKAHDQLLLKWKEAALTRRGGHEWRGVALSVAGPVRLLAAVREPDERIAILMETELSFAPRQPFRFETQGLSLADQRRPAENVFRLAITLERNELREVFEALCGDLIEVVSEVGTPAEALSTVSKRLEAWCACLRVRKSGLTREEQIGLLGELQLLQIIGGAIGYHSAADAWQGPLGGIHDFIRGGSAVEVKSILGIGTHIYVSRLNQLETSGLTNLTIARPRFRLGSGGRSLPQAVKVMRSDIMASAPGALALFDEKLLMAGYLEVDEPIYEANLFIWESVRYFTVSEGFPKITRDALPAGIVDASYIIDERSIVEFGQADDHFLQMLNRNFGHPL